MAAPDIPTIAEALLAGPARFDFFQAVRLLERVFPGRAPVGHYADPSEEAVRFHAHNSLVFPPSEVVALQPPTAASPDTPSHLWVAFMGMTGPQGALPLHYTSLLADPGARSATGALAAFLDIFTHRFVSLFYRAWEKYRFPIAYERGEADKFSQYLFSIVGLGSSHLRRRLTFNDQVLLYYAGLLAQRPRSAAALEGLLTDFFDVPVRVEQFTGEWFLMNPDTLTGLGTQNHQLGVSTVLWQRIMDPQARFRVSVGPMNYGQFREFLPTGPAYARLIELTRLFVGDEFGFEVRPLLDAEDVPACTLGLDSGQRLGWSMWMPTAEPPTSLVQPTFDARVPLPAVSEVATL